MRIQKGQKFSQSDAEILKKKLSVYVPKNQIQETSGTPTSTPVPASKPETAPAAMTETVTPQASPATSTPPSAKVTSVINENNNLQLAEKTTSTSSTDVQKQKTVNVELQQQAYRGPMPSVRNAEITFQRMIYDSTRVA